MKELDRDKQREWNSEKEREWEKKKIESDLEKWRERKTNRYTYLHKSFFLDLSINIDIVQVFFLML